MKPFITTRRVSSIVTFTALSVIFSSLSAYAQTNSVAAVASISPANSEQQQEPVAKWWGQASEKTASVAIDSVSEYEPVTTPTAIKSLPKELNTSNAVAIEPAAQTQENLTVLQDSAPAPIAEVNSVASSATEPAPALPAQTTSTEPVLDRSFSTSAVDLTPDPASSQQAGANEKTPGTIAQIDRADRIPGANFIGIGGNIGDNEDFLDLVILSKVRLFEFPFQEDRFFTVSARPSLAFSNGILDIRLPATVEFKQPTFDTDEPSDRLGFFAGGGVAVSLEKDDDSEFDLMLTGGADYLFTEDLTLTAMVNFLFLDDVDIEGQLGVGFNF